MSDTSNSAREMTEGFRYIADVYVNASRMLLSCDLVVAEYGFVPYATWGIGESPKRMAAKPKTWMAHYAVRQYYPKDRRDQEILTIGAQFWDPESPDDVEPLCVASMMAVNGIPDAVYWLGMLGARLRSPRGNVQIVDATAVPNAVERKQLETLVRDGRLLSIAVPLLEVTSTSAIEESLIKPLVAKLETSNSGGFVMPPLTPRDG